MRLRWFHSIAGAAALALTAFIALPGPPPAVAAKQKPAAPHGKAAPAPVAPLPIIGPIDTQATHAMILEAETGAVLLDKGSDQRMPPASMSKIMTAYLVYDALKKGKLSLEDILPVSEKAWRTQGSKMFVPYPGRVKVEDLVRGMIVQSGNDACIVLAEGIAG